MIIRILCDFAVTAREVVSLTVNVTGIWTGSGRDLDGIEVKGKKKAYLKLSLLSTFF